MDHSDGNPYDRKQNNGRYVITAKKKRVITRANDIETLKTKDAPATTALS